MSRPPGAQGVTGHVIRDVAQERAADADGYRRSFRVGVGRRQDQRHNRDLCPITFTLREQK